MADIAGVCLTAEDRDLLRHPNVGGVILFARNYESVEQLCALTAEIHALREPRLLIGVDQEGGRVQRFREGFTSLPPAAVYGERYAENPSLACELAELHGWLMAMELLAVGVDMSFAPVLDLCRHAEGVIGNRAFHADPRIVAQLGAAMMRGMRSAGMGAIGKHFPGHGGVATDTHHQTAIDTRDLSALEAEDLLPYRELIAQGLAGIMTTHVVFPQIDALPATYSAAWLRNYLRGVLGFQGAICSDDLGMAAARGLGSFLQSAEQALQAGCDLLLPCNDRQACLAIVEGLKQPINAESASRRVRLQGRSSYNWPRLMQLPAWRTARQRIQA